MESRGFRLHFDVKLSGNEDPQHERLPEEMLTKQVDAESCISSVSYSQLVVR